jgi:hypothetical protein
VYVIDPPGGTETEEEGNSGEAVDLLNLDLVLCHKLSSTDENPFSPSDLVQERLRVQNRMVKDVRKALRPPRANGTPDLTLGGVVVDSNGNGVVENLMLPSVDRSAENTFYEGWAIAFMRCVVQLSYRMVNP